MTDYGTLTINDQIRLDKLMKQIKQMYEQLKQCEHTPIQSTIIDSLLIKCDQTIKLLNENCLATSENAMKKQKVGQIRQKIKQVKLKIQKNQADNPQIGHGGRNYKIAQKLDYNIQDLQAQFGQNTINQTAVKNNGQKTNNIDINKLKYEQVDRNSINNHENQKIELDSSEIEGSRRILRSIAIHQMKSVNLLYTKEELDEVLKRLEKNQEVMKAIEEMTIDQGKNLDKVTENIEKAYSNIQQANVQLAQAEQHQIKHIKVVSKAFRLTASGFWGIVSWPIRKLWKLFTL